MRFFKKYGNKTNIIFATQFCIFLVCVKYCIIWQSDITYLKHVTIESKHNRVGITGLL